MTDQPFTHFQRVLIAIDNSKHAMRAAQAGQELAAQLGAKVLIVHVVEPAPPATPDYVPPQYLEDRRQQLASELIEQVRNTFPPDSKPDVQKRDGQISEEVIAAAKEWEADLIVIGSSGRGRFAQLMLGSTADAIVRHAACPVLTVAHDVSLHEHHVPNRVEAKSNSLASARANQASA